MQRTTEGSRFLLEGVWDCVDHWELVVKIKHPDGRIAEYEDDGWLKSDFPTLEEVKAGMRYQWTEGNYSCDCNRSRFFAISVEGGPEDPGEVPCGDTYEVIWPDWIVGKTAW